MWIIKRIRDYGIVIGNGKTGRLNKITDVLGVKVGHYTLEDDRHNTGITVILPCSDNPYINKVMATSYVINGYGKTQGLVQVWSSINCLKPKYADYTWIDRRTNKEIRWKQPFHILVVIGYNKDKVVVSDPDSGSIREFDREKFENAYNFFGKRALYYDKLI